MKNKHNLFRMHNQIDNKESKEVVEFVKGYFDLYNEKVKISIVEFKLDSELAQPKGKMFDLILHTSDENKVRLVHACAWTYVTMKEKK